MFLAHFPVGEQQTSALAQWEAESFSGSRPCDQKEPFTTSSERKRTLCSGSVSNVQSNVVINNVFSLSN